MNLRERCKLTYTVGYS